MSKKQQFKGLKFNYSINGKGLKSKYKTIEDFLNTEFPKNNNPLSPTLDTEITGIKWNGNTISITNKIHTVRDLVDLLSKENAENVFISNKDIRLHEFKPKHDDLIRKSTYSIEEVYDKVKDVEFLIMGIGDLACDSCPIQASQFESDIRIAEQLDKIYFEFGGGGNSYESYTAAWYFGSRHTKLDCLNRGRKGIIITMGDEQLNPYLPFKGRGHGLSEVTGDNLQSDVETKDLYEEASQKFNIYHLDVNHGYRWDEEEIEKSYKKYLDDTHFRRVTMDSITNEIVDIIVSEAENNVTNTVTTPSNSEGITW
jgi:hypothetical protein